MNKLIISTAVMVLLCICTGCPSMNTTVTGNGIRITKELPHQGFTAVSIGGSWKVEIAYSETFSIKIEADENLFDFFDISVSDNTLHLKTKRGYTIVSPKCPNAGNKAFITMPVLTHLSGSGATTATVLEFNRPESDLSVAISGNGDIIANNISINNVKLTISGSGAFVSTGRAQNMTAVVSGSGKVQAANLEVNTADVSISGSGSAELWVTEKLKADISGSGTVRYKGNPTLSQSISGSGSISTLD